MGRVLWSALFFAMACGGDDGARTEVVNEGQVCLQLQPSGLVRAEVTFRHCLTSCDAVRERSCVVAARDGGGQTVVVVESRAVLETSDPSFCTAACNALTVSCVSSEQLAPGSYAVQHGEDTGKVTLGSQPACLGG